MTLTHRQARRKLGSRSNRRRATNGKNIPGRPLANSGRVVFKYRFPRKVSRRNVLQVAKLVKESANAN
jgi:hypothetical protein